MCSTKMGKPAHTSKSQTAPIDIDEVIEMALSDHTTFSQINYLYGLTEPEVKALMRKHLKTGSYRAWRRRVRAFSDRRHVYK